MITLIREVGILPGKVAAGVAFAIEINAYVKDKHGLDIEVVRPVGANPQRVAWCARHKDLAALEAATNKLNGDKRFAELAAKSAELWVPGTMQDAIWQSV